MPTRAALGISPGMRDETDSIYGKPKFGLIVALFGVALLVMLLLAFLYVRTGHPVFHTQPQPRNNNGLLLRFAPVHSRQPTIA